MMPCSQCGKDLDQESKNALKASISGSIMGDETTESFFFCQECEQYTVEISHDRFCGETSVRYEGPLSKSDAEPRITLIRRCERPWDKKCRCEAHQTYFDNWLD